MTAITIKRAFNNTTNLISAAKEKSNSFAYGVKKFFYNLITLGFGKSMETARDERRENEIVHVAFDVLRGLPKDHTDLEKPEFKSKTLHTNFDKKYQIMQEGKDLCLYTGNVSQSPLNGKNNFDKDENSRMVLKTFSEEADFSTFKKELEPVKQNPIYKSLVEQQHVAATKIQAGVRRLQSRIAQKEPNAYGNKEFKYTKGKTNQAFIFSKNNVGHTLPEATIVNSKNKGMFKTVIGNDGKNILFKRNKVPVGAKPPVPKYKAHEIEEILLRNDIKSYKVTTQISKDRYIAHNAGDQDLESVIFENKQTVPVKEFKEILLDTKQLHSKGFYHLDIKPGNIQCKQLQNGKMKLSMIDLDSFSSLNRLINYAGSPKQSQEELFIQNFGDKLKNPNPTDKSLRVADEFALALTLMEASGIKIPQNNNGLYHMRKGSLTITSTMEQFIQRNVKPDFQARFRLLVQNPHSYANSENSTDAYLFDMLNIGD